MQNINRRRIYLEASGAALAVSAAVANPAFAAWPQCPGHWHAGRKRQTARITLPGPHR